LELLSALGKRAKDSCGAVKAPVNRQISGKRQRADFNAVVMKCFPNRGMDTLALWRNSRKRSGGESARDCSLTESFEVKKWVEFLRSFWL
jgi:hypothetical protein